MGKPTFLSVRHLLGSRESALAQRNFSLKLPILHLKVQLACCFEWGDTPVLGFDILARAAVLAIRCTVFCRSNYFETVRLEANLT